MQLVAHMAPPPVAHRPFEQALVCASVQEPAPLQTDSVVIMPSLQAAAAHTVPALGKVHASVSAPSHCPWQGAVPGQASRGATGVPVTAVQLPTVLASLHDSHCPSQALSQQTPSAQ